ncbi:MAG: hypothetical protein GY926_19360 [bacterium]|nr:hypothetical protein [bacterium]
MAVDDPWGISDAGFYRPRADEVREFAVDTWKSVFGAGRNTESDTIDGHFIDFASEFAAKLWEGLEATYGSAYTATAGGVQLRELGNDMIGPAKGALATTVSLVFYGTDTTAVPIATSATESVSNEPFSTDAAATVGAGDTTFVAEMTTPADSTIMRVTINGTDFDHTTSGAETPTFIAASLADEVNAGAEPATAVAIGGLLALDEDDGGSMTVAVFDDDTGTRITLSDAARVATTATNTGPTTIVEGSTWELSNPISGVDGVLNTADGLTGQNDETDPEYRTRIRSSVVFGDATAAVLALDGVTFARTYENDTDAVDGEGRPAHSIEAVVLGGDDDEIAQAIWDSRRQGIQTFGSESGTATDSAGASHTMYFNRVTQTTVYVDAIVTQGEDWPAAGSPLVDIETAIVDAVNALTVGQDVSPARLVNAIYDAVPQVADAALEIDTITPPVATSTLSIGIRQTASTTAAEVNVS